MNIQLVARVYGTAAFPISRVQMKKLANGLNIGFYIY